ncbi:hypothetical protein PENTCL1PPCAC_20256 [Pristionchus entomophagus]|uniref:C-type lectin n=1 Tax=Pristionchus entomophagus TaxID=358040 RepID=A0AAV5TUX5_9BILA|nr:hypothetical protein PENTCL1PPCAC_20256 [Pristionchus entomophagus]
METHALLACIILLGSVRSLTCPPKYQLLDSKCVRSLSYVIEDSLDDLLGKSRNECAKDGAHLPIIKSGAENDYFNKIVTNFPDSKGIFLALDLVCNSNTRRLEWIDGTSITYTPNHLDTNFDCASTGVTATSRPAFNEWLLVESWENFYSYTIMCVIDEYETTATTTMRPTANPTEAQCGDYSAMTGSADGNKSCFKVFTDSVTWNFAQTKCAADFGSLLTINSAEENKYFWRTAISNQMLDGMHIGAHQSTADPSVWVWSDGEVPFTGKTYDNFASYFPIPGAGECAAMLTETAEALWTNENCDRNQQPFICCRADFSTFSKTCPKDAQKAGQDIFSPGLPNSDVPCEYMMFVAANKLVELEIMTLVAADNLDFLEILAGSSGPHLLANLTGTILTPTKFKTADSNVMRVNWKPKGTGSGRGFRIRFNEVEL